MKMKMTVHMHMTVNMKMTAMDIMMKMHMTDEDEDADACFSAVRLPFHCIHIAVTKTHAACRRPCRFYARCIIASWHPGFSPKNALPINRKAGVLGTGNVIGLPVMPPARLVFVFAVVLAGAVPTIGATPEMENHIFASQ